MLVTRQGGLYSSPDARNPHNWLGLLLFNKEKDGGGSGFSKIFYFVSTAGSKGPSPFRFA